MVDMSLRSEQKVKESKTKKSNLESATHLSTCEKILIYFPLSVSALYMLKSIIHVLI